MNATDQVDKKTAMLREWVLDLLTQSKAVALTNDDEFLTVRMTKRPILKRA